MCFHNLLVVGMLKFMVFVCLFVCLFFCTSNVLEENSGDVVFLTFTFSIVVCEDTCAPICFKLGMLLNRPVGRTEIT